MSPEIKISPKEEKEMMDMLMKRLKMSPEFVEARNKLKFGKTVAEKLEALNIERQMILRGGGPEAVTSSRTATKSQSLTAVSC